jgi:hypothetical protein
LNYGIPDPIFPYAPFSVGEKGAVDLNRGIPHPDHLRAVAGMHIGSPFRIHNGSLLRCLLGHFAAKKNAHRGFQAQIVYNDLDLALGELRDTIAFSVESGARTAQFSAHIANRNASLLHFVL